MARPDGSQIPERFKESLIRYTEGLHTGGFLEKVLENDLFGAIARADSEALVALPDIVGYIYNEIPQGCYGSPERVTLWLRMSDAERAAIIGPRS
jgi:hypothetical protein